MKYVYDLIIDKMKKDSLNIYITDALKAIAEISAIQSRVEVRMQRYYDKLHGGSESEKKPKKTTSQIKSEILAEYSKIGGEDN